ncbi:MAG TPA: HYC_CC_PP family protein [Candidatus Wunengus sp. YC63]|uniref:HYC_CC_PP family protein n=1 Tax=Candidatus Wunengus sp. YC63 TaxID=3367699 RepID=UPI00402A284E
MKRIVAIICLLCYTASAIGLSLSFSYCNNELTGVVFSKTEKKNRCCCGDETENECCEHTTISAKKTNEHYRFGSFSLFKKIDNSTLPPFSSHRNSSFSYSHYTVERASLLRPPPLIISYTPLYIAHSVFRI